MIALLFLGPVTVTTTTLPTWCSARSPIAVICGSSATAVDTEIAPLPWLGDFVRAGWEKVTMQLVQVDDCAREAIFVVRGLEVPI